jgi:SAM-dependent methyltransferase
MSAPEQGAAWQQPGLVGTFLDQRQTLLPLLDVQEQLVRLMFERHRRPLRRFLDIGCGDGAMSQLLLDLEPAAEAVLVDYSEPMLRGAERRLGGRPGSWQAVRGDLREPAWRAGLPAGSFDAAVSGFAIHHLEARRKRELFAEVFELLEPGALFVNMDCVVIDGPLRGLLDERIIANAIAAEHVHQGGRSDEEVEREMLSDDDRPDSAEDQLAWLRDAGFEHVGLQFKWAETAVFGAVKPQEGSS